MLCSPGLDVVGPSQDFSSFLAGQSGVGRTWLPLLKIQVLVYYTVSPHDMDEYSVFCIFPRIKKYIKNT